MKEQEFLNMEVPSFFYEKTRFKSLLFPHKLDVTDPECAGCSIEDCCCVSGVEDYDSCCRARVKDTRTNIEKELDATQLDIDYCEAYIDFKESQLNSEDCGAHIDIKELDIIADQIVERIALCIKKDQLQAV